jgi:hypothetical protein
MADELAALESITVMDGAPTNYARGGYYVPKAGFFSPRVDADQLEAETLAAIDEIQAALDAEHEARRIDAAIDEELDAVTFEANVDTTLTKSDGTMEGFSRGEPVAPEKPKRKRTKKAE